eukprot:Nitzschia sp. Nitz4//scaffold397_size11424//2285//3793//NITZ4_009039-RA/size11424-snap-gene-0.11-mRNA-1//-1//CDS//3329550278//3255//frame0
MRSVLAVCDWIVRLSLPHPLDFIIGSVQHKSRLDLERQTFNMKLSIALTAITATLASANPFAPAKSANSAKSAYVSKLTSGARVVRALEEDYAVDISTYSLKFQRCQFVKSYDDELAENEESVTVLSTKRFVVFRLCPSSSCSSCNSGYGEYIVDLETYLQTTVEYQQELQEEMCNACQECGNWGGDEEGAQDEGERIRRKLEQSNVDCDTCYNDCLKMENLEENGYVEATDFIECQRLYDNEDDDQAALYGGAMCDSNGYKINIGVFTDEDCTIQDATKDVNDYLENDGVQLQLSHALLKTTYSSSCISCTQPQDANEDGDEDGDEQEAATLELCENLYEASAKCESSHSFAASYYQSANQAASEDAVCDFISSVLSGTYDETGDIAVTGSSSYSSGSSTSGGQRTALVFFILSTAGLAVYAAMLHSKLTKGGASGLASNQGGAMA